MLIVHARDYTSITARQKLGNEALPGGSSKETRHFCRVVAQSHVSVEEVHSRPPGYEAHERPSCSISHWREPTQVGTTPSFACRAWVGTDGEVEIEAALSTSAATWPTTTLP
jgi:hypothetical protein